MDEHLVPALATWLRETLGVPTPAQSATAPHIRAGDHVLLSSPTGSGKTLAAFLPILSQLAEDAPPPGRIHCIYLSPLRALVNDMARNLDAPIRGAGLDIRVAVRTGDTPPSERQRQVRHPPHILVTTPESLALLLASPKAREGLRGLRWVVVDEVHAIAESKRGAQMGLTLERLAVFAGEFQRIGLSATVSPLPRVAAFLGGDRPVARVEVPPGPPARLDIALALDDPLAHPEHEVDEAVLGIIDDAMAVARTTIVFTNTRAQAERIAGALRLRHPTELDEDSIDPEFGPAAPLDDIAAHHGSMSRESRLVVEDRLKHAHVRCVVASGSLELGIHAEQVDRVILLGSPKSAARTLQRIGRSGHLPGAQAQATLIVTDPGDLPEAFAIRSLVLDRRVEDVTIPENALDVLSQHLCALRLDHDISEDEAFALTRRAWSYRELSRDVFDQVYDRLPRVARFEYLQNAGTIPEAGLLKVVDGDRFVGEVDEAFASGLQPRDVFALAGRAWRFLRATPARVAVEPARGEVPTVPTWRGEGISATKMVMQATQNTIRGHNHASHGSSVTEYAMWDLLRIQRIATGPFPPVLVETFPTDAGERALVLHTFLGRHANDALARALAHRLDATGETARAVATDAGLALITRRGWRPTRALLTRLLKEPIGADLEASLAGSELFKRRFRHVAARALLLRRRPGETLGMRQVESNRLLGWLLRDHPDDPLLTETMRECKHDALDVAAADAWRAGVAADPQMLTLLERQPFASPLAARILAPPGAGRHEALRDNADRWSYQSERALDATPRRGGR